MTYVAWAIAFVWLSVALFFCGRQMNLQRLMFNNLAPAVNVGGPEADSIRKVMTFGIKPELLNAEGQKYLKKSNRNGWLFGAWMFLGLLLAAWLSSYFTAP
jgi:hypothetical protein